MKKLSHRLLSLLRQYPEWVVGLAVLLSRWALWVPRDVFYDTGQYIERVGYQPLTLALSSGHAPFHPAFVFTNYLVYNTLGQWLGLSSAMSMVLVNGVMSAGSVVLLAKLFAPYLGRGRAMVAAGLAALYPTFYVLGITPANDMHYLFFVLLSLWAFQTALQGWPLPAHRGWLVGSSLALGYAFWGHTQVVLWAPAYLAILAIELRSGWQERFKPPLSRFGSALKALAPAVGWFMIGPLLAVAAYVWVMVQPNYPVDYGFDVRSALAYLFFNNAGDFRENFGFAMVFRFLLTQLSSVGIGMSLLALLLMSWRQRFGGLLMSLLVLVLFYPAILYQYGSFYGRTMVLWGLLCWVAVGWLLTIIWTRFRVWGKAVAVLAAAYLIQFGLYPVLAMQTERYPHESAQTMERRLEQGNYLMNVQDAYAPWWYVYEGQLATMEEDCWATNFGCVAEMEQLAAQGKKIYLTTQAIFYSGYKFDGLFWQVDRAEFQLFPGSSIEPNLRDGRVDLAAYDDYQAIYQLNLDGRATDTAARLLQNAEALQPGQSLLVLSELAGNVRQVSTSGEGPWTVFSSHRLNRQDWLVQAWMYWQDVRNRDFARSILVDRTGWASLPYEDNHRVHLLLTDGTVLSLEPDWTESEPIQLQQIPTLADSSGPEQMWRIEKFDGGMVRVSSLSVQDALR